MAKRIIVLSDGTGNSAAKVWRTNVWRSFEALELSGSNQVAFYDDGVGTSSFKPLAILGGAFGYGLKRNIIELYKFLCRNYKSAGDYSNLYGQVSGDDEIFGFGFSRGAFTIRVLVGLVLDQGLVRADTDAQLDTLAKEAYRNYRARHFHTEWGIEKPFRFMRDWLLRRSGGGRLPQARPIQSIRFLGLWDTVAAYGLPVDEMTRGVGRYLWPLELPSHQIDQAKVVRACHALSLDDQRTTFHPILWDESNLPARPDPLPAPYTTAHEQVTQIWFAGVHANVGGGYPDDSLAYIPMWWIWKEAKECGLVFKAIPSADPDALLNAASKRDKDGRLYDSRSGLGGYYRYGPRSVHELCNFASPDPRDCVSISRPKIHSSVFERLAIGAHSYAPISLPSVYDVVKYDPATGLHEIVGAAAPYREPAPAAVTRYEDQEKTVWSTVWRGRGTYFLTVLASLYLAGYPLADPAIRTAEFATRLRFISDTIRFVSIPLPSAADRWVDAYAADPALFLISVVAIAVLLLLSAGLHARISDQMRRLFGLSLVPPNNLQQTAAVTDEWRPSGAVDYLVLSLLIVAPIAGLVVNPFLSWPSWIGDALVVFLGRIPTFLGLLALITIIILLIPARLVARLRASPTYKRCLRALRFKWAPLFFAILFAVCIFEFASHYLFDIRDSFGSFCPHDKAVTETRSEIETICDKTNAQQCITSAPCRDSAGRTIACPFRAILVDTRDLCTATHLYLDKNQRYHAFIRMANESEIDSYKVTHANFSDATWRMLGIESNPAGKTLSQLGDWRIQSCSQLVNWDLWGHVGHQFLTLCNYFAGKGRQSWAIGFYPLKRTFDRPIGRFVLRYGDTGNEENPIDPDIPAPRDGRLDEIFKPTRDGELFLYLNKLEFGFWKEMFHNFNSGLASVTVVRIPPKN